MNAMTMHDMPDIESVMASPLAKFITFTANDCDYNGSAKDLMVNWIHPFFLQAKAATSKEDNPNWNQAMNGPFADKYWKAACQEVETLEGAQELQVQERKWRAAPRKA